MVRLASGGLLVCVTAFYLVHTSPVRVFVLGWMGPKLSRAAGLTLRAQTLEYNLAKGWFQLGGVSVGMDGSPALLRARRLAVQVSTLDLLHGELSRAQISAEGVSVHLERSAAGRWNWPASPGGDVRIKLAGYFHSLHIDDLAMVVVDKSSGVSVELPQGRLDAAWQTSQYRVSYRTAGKGRLQAGDFTAPLDDFLLSANLGGEALVLERLSMEAGNSGIVVDHARLGFAGADLAAAGSAAIDAGQFVRNASGMARAEFSISGTTGAPIADVRIASDGVKTGEWQVGGITLAARYREQKLEIREAAARVYGARVGLRGVLDAIGAQPRTRATVRVDGIAVDRLLGELGWKAPHPLRGAARIEVTCAGTDWRKGRVSGVLRVAPAAALSFQAHMEGQRLALRIDSERTAEVNATGAVWLGTADKSLRGTLGGRVQSLSRAGQFLGVRDSVLSEGLLDGALDWQVNLAGSVSRPKIGFTAGSTNVSLPTVKAAALDLAGRYDDSGIRLERLRLWSGGQELAASGMLGADSHLQIDGTIKGIALGNLLEATSGSAHGEFTVRGTTARPEANARVAIGDLQAYGRPLGSLEALADFRDGVLSVGRLHLEQPRQEGAGKLDASGSLTLDGRRFQFRATGSGLRIDDPAVRGEVTFEAEGKGSFENPEGKLVAEARHVATDALPIGRVNAEITYAGHRAVAVVKAPDLNASARAELQVSGEYPVDFGISSTGTRIRTQHLGRTISGWLEGAASGRATLGTSELQTASVSLRNTEVEVDGYKIEAGGPIQADYQNGRLSIAPVWLTAPSARIQISGALPLEADHPPGRISIAGTVRMDEALKDLGVDGGGEINIDAAIAGSLKKWEPGLNLTLENGRLEEKRLGLAAGQMKAQALIAGGLLRLEGLTGHLGGGEMRASATVPLHLIAGQFDPPATDPEQPARWSLETRQTQIHVGGPDGAGVLLSLRTTGEAPRLALADAKGVVEFDELSLRAKHGEMKQAGRTRIAIDHSVARLEAMELRGPAATLRISGTSTIGADPVMDIQVAGETDASVPAMVSPSLDAAGRITMDLRLKGSPQSPAGSGSVELNGVSLSVRDAPVHAEEVTGRIDLVDDRFVLSGLSGRLNGGKFSGAGEARLHDGKLADVEIRGQGENVFLDYPAGLRTSSNLNLALRSGERGLVLSGQVDVRDGVFRDTLDLGLKGMEGTAMPGGAVREADSIALDIAIVTAEPVEMDNNIGKLGVNGNLRVRGTVDNPVLGGEIRLEEGGRIYFGDRRYDVERGSVRLDTTNQSDPQISLVAATRVSNFDIRLHLSGSAKNLTTTFTSDPPLSKNDIISVLLTGRTVAENRGVDLRKLEAYSLLSGALNASVGGSLGRKLGISQVSVQPGMIAAESDPETRLTITQDFARTLRLIYSMSLSNSSDQIWIVEYDLARRFQARAVKESDNSYRAEVRHEIRFGKSGPSGAAEQNFATPKRTIREVRFQGGGPFQEEQLARLFQVKAKQTYRPLAVRKGTDRLLGFLRKKGYMEARVHVNREEREGGVWLTAELRPGPLETVEFTGDPAPRSVRNRIRQAWESGQTDKQRIAAAQQIVTGHYGRQGFLQAAAECKIQASGGDGRQVLFDTRRGRRYSNVHLEIEGASPGHGEEILATIGKAKLQEAVYAEPRRVTEAAVQYYRRLGYLAAEVEAPHLRIDEKAGTGQIVMRVTEGPAFRVGEIRFAGNHAITENALRADLPLSTGGTFEPARLSAAVTALRRKYESQGYRDILIDYELKPDAAEGVMDVAFSLQEKDQRVVQAVEIEGNSQTSDKFVRSQLAVSEGRPEDGSQISESIQNLSRTGAFASVDIESRPAGNNFRAPQIGTDLLVKLREAKPFRVQYGGLYSTAAGVGFIADFENHNSLGSARVLGVRTRYDTDTQEVRLYLTQPVWGRKAVSTTATTYVTHEKVAEGVQQNKLGASVQQDWPFRAKFLLSYGYRYERSRLVTPPADTRSVPPDQVATAPVFFTGSRDTRDSFLDATRGSFAALGTEIAPGWLGSDYGYVRWFGQYYKYFPLKQPLPGAFGESPRRSRLVYATAVRVGLQTALNPDGIILTDRFFAGGGTTIRGFSQDSIGPQSADGKPLGGNAMLVLNNELRFPLFRFLDAVAFSDMGNVYANVSQFRLSDMRKSAGFGLRIRNPFVLLRFDYGVKLDRRTGERFGAFFFSIGQAF